MKFYQVSPDPPPTPTHLARSLAHPSRLLTKLTTSSYLEIVETRTLTREHYDLRIEIYRDFARFRNKRSSDGVWILSD